jgi:large subunit ribosomal protein L4
MPSVQGFKKDGSAGAKVKLNEKIFDVEPNVGLIHQVVTSLLSNQQIGNHESKVRKEVRGGGRKPFRQKGTGRARQGSSREPHMRGGGVVFGPHKRSHRKRINRKMARKALCGALTDRVRNEALCVLDEFSMDAPRTKPMLDLWTKLSPEGRQTLLVTGEIQPVLLRSARNIERVTIRTAADVNALDVIGSRRIILMQDALPKLEERLA